MFFSPNKHSLRGFTLLELLIVIGIIGVLSSITIVSYKDYSKKARLSNAMQYAKSVQSELGAYAVGGWSFDNITGNTVLDDSGNGNHGTIYGATQVEGVIGKALSFDGVDDYVKIGNILNMGNATNFTLAAWINTASPLTSGERMAMDKKWSASVSYAGYQFGTKYGDVIMYLSDGVSDKRLRVNTNFSNDNVWHYIVAVVDRQNNMVNIYVDGVNAVNKYGIVEGSTDISGLGSLDNTRNLAIGATGYYWAGLIDDVRIYSEAFTQAQIQQHYAEGLKTHQNLARIERFRNTPD